MDRKEFLAKLELVHPAIGDSIPVMEHYWFTGANLLAYNDRIGIQTPLVTDFVGAVPGKLYSWLNASLASNVELTANGTHVHVKAARAHRNFATLPPEAFQPLFQMPASVTHEVAGDDKQELFEALDYCMLSTSKDTARPEYLGVTVVPGKGSCVLYATNGKTLSRSIIPAVPAFPSRTLIPATFCKALLKLGKDAQAIRLGAYADHVLAEVDDARIFGRVLETTTPIDFTTLFARHWTVASNGFTAIPGVFKNIVERATLTAKATDHKSQVTVRDGELDMRTKADDGDSGDKLALDHADASVLVDPHLLKVGLKVGVGLFTRIHISDEAILLASDYDRHVYLIGTTAS